MKAEFMSTVDWLLHGGVAFALNLLTAALILFFGSFATRAIVAATRKSLKRMKRVEELLATFICSVVSKTCWAILAVLALARLGVEVGPLVASLGVTGVVLGFAFKESLGSLAAGLMIALNHPFKVGDYVVAGGVEGTVLELNMMATVLATSDNKRVTVPNGLVWGKPVTNFTALGIRRVDLAVGVAYGSNLDDAIRVARETVAGVPGVLADPPPVVRVLSLDASSVTIALRPWATCGDYWNVHSAVQKAIEEAYSAAGIEIPFPQVAVHVENG